MTELENLHESVSDSVQYPSNNVPNNPTNRSVPPDSLSPPEIDPDLERESWPVRSAETLKYTIHSLEYILSPSGRLRHWVKANLLLFLWIGIPILLFLPPLTYLFNGLASISESIQVCISNLVGSILPIALLGIFLFILIALIRR